jgi:diadenylate cyclase
MVAHSWRWVLDVADILIVAFLIYHLFLLVRGTRAAQMFLGLVAIVLLSALADLAHLSALNWLLASLKTVWVVAFLIIFQPELRKGLSQIGHSRLFRRIFTLHETSHLGEIEDALLSLRKRGLGAILVLERNTGLRSYADTGTVLEANLNAELIETIFTPPSPLHDGAVIIRDNQILAAGCILPLSQSLSLARTLGTRHRAILGVSEETDALAIAVSEETRQISIAEEGRLIQNIDPNALKEILSQFVSSREEREESAGESAKSPAAPAPAAPAAKTEMPPTPTVAPPPEEKSGIASSS